MVEFKKDSDYSTPISLTPVRDLPEGHKGFQFNKDNSEVEALQKILDAYIDTSSMESMLSFYEHRIDFGVTFIDSMIIMMTDKRSVVQAQYDDIEKQLEAISHRMIKPFIDGTMPTNAEKLEIYEQQERLLIQRRNLKDLIAVLKVSIENFENTRNFILGMSKRKYTPQTEKFKNDERFQLGRRSRNIHQDIMNPDTSTDNTRLNLSK